MGYGVRLPRVGYVRERAAEVVNGEGHVEKGLDRAVTGVNGCVSAQPKHEDVEAAETGDVEAYWAGEKAKEGGS